MSVYLIDINLVLQVRVRYAAAEIRVIYGIRK